VPAFCFEKNASTMSSMPTDRVEYLFLGLGAANCLLVLSLHERGLLLGKSIAIIEPNSNNLNDRNFCFWSTENEVARLNLSSLINSSWEQIKVAECAPQLISPLKYFHIKGIDLYERVEEILKFQRVSFYTEKFVGQPCEKSGSFRITLGDTIVIANKVYDSRPPKYQTTENNQSHLLQSFYGWTLKIQDYTLDQSTMVMMDFDIPQNDCCQFMYILPFTGDTALFEVTRFGKEKISKEQAELILDEYVTRYGFSYQILEEEKGVIPMSSAAIENVDYGLKWVKTGANANMVKPTTGYAFYNMAIDAEKNAEALLSDQAYKRVEHHSRFKYYDGLLLKILEEKPRLGKKIFQSLFKRTPIKTVLKFLSEKSTPNLEILIFSRLPIFVFLLVAFKDLGYRISKISPVLIALTVTLMMTALSAFHYEKILYIFLIAGFFTIGLSHGAVDHITSLKNNGFKQLLKFSIEYMAKGVLLGLLWIMLPDLALLVFLIFSAWHFGQADFKEWNINRKGSSLLWGGLVLSIILFFHLEETIVVLKSINGLEIQHTLIGVSENALLAGQIVLVSCSLLVAAFFKSREMLLTLGYLLLSMTLPLFVSFGIYFVLQHSLHGWRHLKSGLKMNSYNLWVKSLPFSVGGAVIISAFMLTNSANYVGLFFILLSCLSMPHVMSMNHFYVRLGSSKN
jgi:lycopene beta-cyclase